MSRSRESAPSRSPDTARQSAEDQGLDPALLLALATGHPAAVSAAAGLLDNSLIAAVIGRDSGRDDSRVATIDRADARETETDRGREGGSEHLQERGLPAGSSTEGSGEHGRLDPSAVDYANHAFWRAVAAGAEGAGLVQAARHMNHFLDNSGSELEVDLDVLEASNSKFAENVEDAHASAIEGALMALDEADTTQGGTWSEEARFTGRDSYFTRSSSEDWYFAIGGNTHSMNTQVTYTPDANGNGAGTLDFVGTWRLHDRYNWDGGKSVNIMGVHVNDEVLGRLHVVGIAQEYDIGGSRVDGFSVRFEGQTPEEGAEANAGGGRGETREPRAGRDDLGRERR